MNNDEEYWDGDTGEEDEVLDETPSETSTYVRVNNSNQPLHAGDPFSSIKEIALSAGLGKFRVFLNGQEVRPKDAPDTIQEGDNVELRPYDSAG